MQELTRGMLRTTTKEMIDPIQIVRMMELDFSERYPEDGTLSQNNLKFYP